MQTRRNIFLWILYDFANSLVSVVFFLYFAQWIVIEQGISDFAYNLTYTISAVLLLFTVPLTGSLLDKSLRRITGLRYTTVLTALFYGGCAISAINGFSVIALALFTLGMYTYLLSFTFYTPLINDISSENKRGSVSGWGIFANYVGQIAGLLIALPISTGSWSFFGSSPRAETLLPSVILFILFALPMLLMFKETSRVKIRHSLRDHVKSVFADTKFLMSSSGVGLFLLAYFLFNDAILTAANNFSIFLEQVWHIPDTVKTYLLLSILVTSALGGIIGGAIADRFGQKRTLM